MTLLAEGEFNTWTCPNGHGLAATLSESYEVAQEDDLRRLWQIAKDGDVVAGARNCPMCSQPMVSVTAPVDADEASEGGPGDTADSDEVPVDVCVDDQLIWFDTGEVDRFPRDLPDPEPTPEQLAVLEKIRKDFGESVEAGYAERASMSDRLVDRLIKSPGAFGNLARRLQRDPKPPSQDL